MHPNKNYISIALFIIMLSGLFWSRAVLSLSMAVWVLFAIWQYKAWMPLAKKDPLIIWSICPLVLAFLGCYRQPFALANYDYLLTLSVYPVAALAVRSTKQETIKQVWIPAWKWAALTGLVYPLGWYLLHVRQTHLAYGTGRSLPVFMESDHVRFGIFICCSLLLALLYRNRFAVANNLFIAILSFSIILLSVRTAWVILVVMVVLIMILSMRPGGSQKSKVKSQKNILFIFPLLIIVCVGAYYLFPSVHQKIAYTVYDWQQFRPGIYRPDLSDGARRAINYAAWQAITVSDGANTGWAAIPATLQHSFSKYFPGYTSDYGWPFNQWLFWWMGSGWWGMLLFTAWLFYPLVWGWKHHNKGLVCWTAAITVSCIAECTLGYQYGVWLHAWGIAVIWEIQAIKNYKDHLHAPMVQQAVTPFLNR